MRRFAKTSSALALSLASLALPSCGPGHPRASEVEWSLAQEPASTGYVFEATARLLGGQEGWYTPHLRYLDAGGCERTERLQTLHPISFADPENVKAKFQSRFDTPGKIARATMTLVYRPGSASPGDMGADRTVFEEERVFDATVSQTTELESCDSGQGGAETATERRARLRDRAETDPEGADGEAIDNMGRNELMATAINSAGFLCASVTDMYPSGGDIIVSCVEYRDGRGSVRYRVNPEAGSVDQL